jgi:hypothetical protein
MATKRISHGRNDEREVMNPADQEISITTIVPKEYIYAKWR